VSAGGAVGSVPAHALLHSGIGDGPAEFARIVASML